LIKEIRSLQLDGKEFQYSLPSSWMFSTSVDGEKSSANLYSLVMTCRANDINPYYYFQHLFTELPKRQPTDNMMDLMPWNVALGEAE